MLHDVGALRDVGAKNQEMSWMISRELHLRSQKHPGFLGRNWFLWRELQGGHLTVPFLVFSWQ